MNGKNEKLKFGIVLWGILLFFSLIFVFPNIDIRINVRRVNILHRVNDGGSMPDLESYLFIFNHGKRSSRQLAEEDFVLCGYVLNSIKNTDMVDNMDVDNQYVISPGCQFLVAERLKDLGEIDKAINFYEEVIDKNPKNGRATKTLGNLYYNQDDFQKAIFYYEKLLYSNYEYAALDYFRLSQTYRHEGKYVSARTLIDSAIEKYPDNPWLAQEHAKLLIQVGKEKEAERSLTDFIEDHPDEPRAYYVLCRIQFDINSTDNAIKNCKKAISIDNDFTQAYYWIGKIYYEKGELSQSLKYTRQVTEREKNSGTRLEMLSFVHLGDIYYKLERFDKSLISYCHALSLNQWASKKDYILKRVSQIDGNCQN